MSLKNQTNKHILPFWLRELLSLGIMIGAFILVGLLIYKWLN